MNDGGGATVTHNYIYGDTPTKVLFPNYVDGGTWEEYVPASGGAVDFGTNYGAQQRLEELLSRDRRIVRLWIIRFGIIAEQ